MLTMLKRVKLINFLLYFSFISISLSLEYHPAMLHQCGPGEVPPTIYLQCAAGLPVELLKRFLCSKYNIETDNGLVEVEVTYKDEVLPTNFTLMDVAYCYNWSRVSLFYLIRNISAFL